MVEPRLRANNTFTALVRLILPKRPMWVNALHPRHPTGHLRFQSRIPTIDIAEFAEDGELYAMQTENWNWAGCIHNGEWYRFTSREGYAWELAEFARIDARAKDGDFSFPIN